MFICGLTDTFSDHCRTCPRSFSTSAGLQCTSTPVRSWWPTSSTTSTSPVQNNCKVNTLTVIKNNIMVTYADCDVFISQINLYVSGLPWVFKRDIFVSQRTFVSSLPFVSKCDVFVSQRTFLFQVFLVFPKVTSSFLWKPFCFRISYVSNGDVFVSLKPTPGNSTDVWLSGCVFQGTVGSINLQM